MTHQTAMDEISKEKLYLDSEVSALESEAYSLRLKVEATLAMAAVACTAAKNAARDECARANAAAARTEAANSAARAESARADAALARVQAYESAARDERARVEAAENAAHDERARARAARARAEVSVLMVASTVLLTWVFC